MKTIITYGTFDMLHMGHINILTRLRSLGDRLIVGVSTDEFNEGKGKKALYRYKDRAAILSELRCVDLVIPENTWDQKKTDALAYGVDVFGMGDDWVNKFDFMKEFCEVVYLPRTHGVSSTQLRSLVNVLDDEHVRQLKMTLDVLAGIVKGLN